MDIENMAVCITGAASGIGEATARLLSGMGAKLLLVDKEKKRLVEVAAKLEGAPPVLLVGDLTDPDVSLETMSLASQHYGSLNAVVFAAGTSDNGLLREKSPGDLDAALRSNVLVHFHLSRQILLAQARQGAAHCSLVYIASKLSVAPSSGFGAYPIAKAAELQLARMVAIEGGDLGVRANIVNPGAIVTGSLFWDDSLAEAKAKYHGVDLDELESYYAKRTLLGVRVRTEDVARAVTFLVSPWSRATTGAIIPVDGGLPATFGR